MQDREVEVKVELNLRRLLDQEDLDGDLKITIEDPGPKLFLLEDLKGHFYEVAGCYHLSNLLQILAYAHQAQKSVVKIHTQDITLNPVDHISKEIKERYWDALTRTLDEKGIVALLEDPKTASDQTKRIYVSPKDPKALAYYQELSKKHHFLHLEVYSLPERYTLETHRQLDQKPGILALKLDTTKGKGVPFVVPGGRFNEMYGWDSYFILLGLLEDGRVDLALSLIENFVYEIEHYGAILNANRTYYLSRSQPPLLTSMIGEVLKKTENTEWLESALCAAIVEYQQVWMNPNRKTENGLSRYFGLELKEPPEVERGHFNPIYLKRAKKADLSIEEFKKGYERGTLCDPELDRYFVHDRAMRESGHDTSNRLVNCCAHLNTVDLNALLYKYESDIADLIETFFEGNFALVEGELQKAEMWRKWAQERQERISELMWQEDQGLFLDYNFVKRERSSFESVTAFYPLFAGCASPHQAQQLIEKALPLFEEPGGLVSTTRKSRGIVREDRPQRQWDYPYGWAPHQMLFWKGALRYGYDTHAKRIAYRWLYMLTREACHYNGVLAEKYDVVERSHKAKVEYGNVGTDFGLYPDGGFGWVNASYQLGLSLLSQEEKEALKKLSPPEWVF